MVHAGWLSFSSEVGKQAEVRVDAAEAAINARIHKNADHMLAVLVTREKPSVVAFRISQERGYEPLTLAAKKLMERVIKVEDDKRAFGPALDEVCQRLEAGSAYFVTRAPIYKPLVPEPDLFERVHMAVNLRPKTEYLVMTPSYGV